MLQPSICWVRNLAEDVSSLTLTLILSLFSSNEELVESSDIVFIGLLPEIAKEIIPQMPFNEKHLVISMMAAVDLKVV
jgi:pyrroline-5-carboxylate reductase